MKNLEECYNTEQIEDNNRRIGSWGCQQKTGKECEDDQMKPEMIKGLGLRENYG